LGDWVSKLLRNLVGLKSPLSNLYEHELLSKFVFLRIHFGSNISSVYVFNNSVFLFLTNSNKLLFNGILTLLLLLLLLDDNETELFVELIV